MVNESLSLLERFDESRTVVRLTLVRGLNMVDPEGYAKLISGAAPMFVELKGYTWVGESQKRLPITAMPSMEELVDFGKRIAERSGYTIKLTDEKSRVVLLVRDEDAWEKNLRMVEEWRKLERERDERVFQLVEDFTMEEHGYRLLDY